jgi:hypothetical protein
MAFLCLNIKITGGKANGLQQEFQNFGDIEKNI